jgi:hypothetical protein
MFSIKSETSFATEKLAAQFDQCTVGRKPITPIDGGAIRNLAQNEQN